MSSSTKKLKPQRRRVALFIESSMAGGRDMLRGFAKYVREGNHWAIYYEPGHLRTVLPKWFASWQGDGIIARIRNRAVAQQLLEMKIPIIDVMGNVPHTSIPVVQVDNRAIARLAANHLLEHGFRTFVYCGIRGLSWSQQRSEAFHETIRRLGYVSSHYQLPHTESRRWYSEDERERMARWVNGLPKPVGVMAANDWVGQKILEACRQARVLVPEDVAVIGVDNDEAICEISDPMLSSVIARHDQVGYHAAELLDRLLQGKAPPTTPIIVGAPSVVTRQSTDVQTIDDRDVVTAICFIRENACHNIGVEDVASHVALSYSTLKRRFRKVLSRSVYDEILRVRMERVQELLTGTDMTLAQIAQATGFNHQEYLGAIFKSKMGMTLAQYRTTTRSGS